MGTTGSIIGDRNVEMNIDMVDVNDGSKQDGSKEDRHKSSKESKRLVKKTTNSSFISYGWGLARSKNKETVHTSASLPSIDAPSPHLLTVPHDDKIRIRKENELKITQEQETQANQRKVQKLEVELARLRAELQAQNKQCQKLRTERDAALQSSYEATERATSLEQDREKIQRQFKIFRETKESEIQALLQEKRKSECQLQKLQAHGFATGTDDFANNDVEKPRITDSTSPSQQWWGAAESEDMSLFGSYSHIRPANESLPDMQSTTHLAPDFGKHSLKQGLELNSPKFGSGLLPELSSTDGVEKNYLRIYLTGTTDCADEMKAIMKSQTYKSLVHRCEEEGYFLSIINFKNLTNNHTSPCKLVSNEEIIANGLQMSAVFLCFLGTKLGRYTAMECAVGHLDCVGWRTAVFCIPNIKKHPADGSSKLLSTIEASKCRQLHSYNSLNEGVESALAAITRVVKLEFGVTVANDDELLEEVTCLNEMPLDDAVEQGQQEVVCFDGKIKSICCEKYFERLNELVSSHGPSPPLLISGGLGGGKTSLIRSWLDSVPSIHRNILVFQHFVTGIGSITADPVTVMRRLLHQICSQLPISVAPPPFVMSLYDASQLSTALPRWLEQLYSVRDMKIVLVIDSIDLIENATDHFSWLMDPLPVGARVIVSVSADSCPSSWRVWPTLHLEPFSIQAVRDVSCSQAENYEIQIPVQWENDVLSQCRTASTCHPLYVTLLLRVAYSTCQSHGKESFFRSCLKTRDTAELYRLIIQYIEHETSQEDKAVIRQVLQLIVCSREGLNERELRCMIPHMSWFTWVCMRSILLHFLVVDERSGLVIIHNSLIHNMITEEYLKDKTVEKACIRAMVQWFTDQAEHAVTPRLAELLPWLMKRGKYDQGLRECLLHPKILLHLYKRGRANEIVSYWQYLQEDRENIREYYNRAIASYSNPQHSVHTSTSNLKRPDSGNRHNTVITRKEKSFLTHHSHLVDNIMLAEFYEVLGRFFLDLGLMEQAISKIQHSLELREGEFHPDHPLAANSLHFLASVYAKWKKYAHAEPLYRQSLEIVESLADKTHPRVCQELQALAFILHKQGKHDHTVALHKRVQALQGGNTFLLNNKIDRVKRQTLKLNELVMGSESVSLAKSINELGVMYYLQKNYSSAESFLQRGLEMREKLHGGTHEEVAQSLHNLASMYNEQNVYEKAVDCIKRALKIRKDIFGDTHPSVFGSLKHLAILYKRSGDYEHARDAYNDLLAVYESVHGHSSSKTASVMVNLAIVECKLSNHVAAMPLYEQALQIYTEELGPDSTQAADVLKNIAVLRYEKGEYEKAAVFYKQSIQIKENIKAKASLQWQ